MHPCELDAGNPCRHDDYLCNGYFDTMLYTLSNKFTPCSCGLPKKAPGYDQARTPSDAGCQPLFIEEYKTNL
jgi:hypothetical protein